MNNSQSVSQNLSDRSDAITKQYFEGRLSQDLWRQETDKLAREVFYQYFIIH